jgi:hypothetical protein
VKCDGCTIDEFVTSEYSEMSIHHTFPQEEPTPADFRIWRDAIHQLGNRTTRLPYTLGHYLRQFHLPTVWYTDSTASRLFRSNNITKTKKYDIFLHCKDGMRTRHGAQYLWSSTVSGVHGGTHHRSFTMTSNERAVLHSRTPICIPVSRPTSFLSALENYGNPSLWANISVDGDGEWIRAGIKANTLVIAHDSSYMPEQSTILCSAGIIIYCQHTFQWLKASIVKKSKAASNYRGELLGAVMALLIIRAATVSVTIPQLCMTLFCDNNGVISHGNSPWSSLPEKQQQADLIHLLKNLSTSSIYPILWKWVEGHAVERKGWTAAPCQNVSTIKQIFWRRMHSSRG